MELLALIREDLVGIFLPARHPLQLSQVLSARQLVLQLLMPLLVVLEFHTNLFHNKAPLLLKHVVLFKAGPHVPLILLVVSGNLRFALLENFDFKATLSWPLLSQVLIQFFNRLVL